MEFWNVPINIFLKLRSECHNFKSLYSWIFTQWIPFVCCKVLMVWKRKFKLVCKIFDGQSVRALHQGILNHQSDTHCAQK